MATDAVGDKHGPCALFGDGTALARHRCGDRDRWEFIFYWKGILGVRRDESGQFWPEA